jgi:hypothetical protein
MDLYFHSPICLHGVVLNLVKHRENVTFIETLTRGRHSFSVVPIWEHLVNV